MELFQQNIRIFRMINDLGKEYPGINPIMIFITEYAIYFLALAVIFFWLSRGLRKRMMVICGFLSFIFAEVAGKLAGMLHSNQQPFAELSNVNQLIDKTVGNSFPSDHTMVFFAFCTTFWLFSRKTGYIWMILAVTVGVSRIWVGVHYPFDVATGALISVVSAITMFAFISNSSSLKSHLETFGKKEKQLFTLKDKSRNF
ncbi:undecaprenyl-diphosphatase [Mesobacillus foraminis]|uniref:undecaprenyl-diphosphatase n=1 Tax=Mesobacillus foraminis TaxID=279826 RepID=UPI000EF48796|nr:undecaprenyl-diphosphatase [Mesobacillus foraminis]